VTFSETREVDYIAEVDVVRTALGPGERQPITVPANAIAVKAYYEVGGEASDWTSHGTTTKGLVIERTDDGAVVKSEPHVGSRSSSW
jgi:hypothetical protein